MVSQTFTQQNIRVLKFKEPGKINELPGQSKNIPNRVNALIKLNIKQNNSDLGLQLSLNIENHTTSEATIANPLDFLNLKLINKAGETQTLINRGVRFKIHTSNGFKYWRFTIHKVLINNIPSTIDLNKETSITIPKNGNFKIFISIGKVSPFNGYSVPFPATDTRQPFPIGNYKLLAMYKTMVIDSPWISYGM
jgi:hypothetical protein